MNKIQVENNDYVFDELTNIIIKRFQKDISGIDKELYDKELIGIEFDFKPRDLIYLYFDIEKQFDISIPQEDIYENRFNTINNIARIVSRQLVVKNINN